MTVPTGEIGAATGIDAATDAKLRAGGRSGLGRSITGLNGGVEETNGDGDGETPAGKQATFKRSTDTVQSTPFLFNTKVLGLSLIHI